MSIVTEPGFVAAACVAAYAFATGYVPTARYGCAEPTCAPDGR